MAYLKFLYRTDLPYIMQDETLLIRKFSYFRQRFEQTGDEWIGDPIDGLSALGLDNFSTGSEISDADRQSLARVGIMVDDPNAKNIYVQSARSYMDFARSAPPQHEPFIFCVSNGEPDQMRAAMMQPSAANPRPYDVCLAITDVGRFYNVLTEAEYYDFTTGQPLNSITKFHRFRDVTYTDRPQSAFEIDHNPYCKRTMFQAQGEARMMFEGTAPPSCDTIKIKGRGIASCFREV